MNPRHGIARFAVLAVVSSAAASWCHAQTPEPVPVTIKKEVEWVMLPPTPDDPDSPAPVITHAAAKISRAVDPDTGKPYIEGWPHECGPNDVRHTFRLEKREFLLGEPILVEYRVSLDGPGTYSEAVAGRYRSRGRDDNFLFLLRREDGTWVPDVQPVGSGVAGGGGGSLTAKPGEPISLWNAVQRWCAIEELGRYDLYCIYAARAHESAGRKEAIEAQIPADVSRTHTVNRFRQLLRRDTNAESDSHVIDMKWVDSKAPLSPLMDEMPAEISSLMREYTIAAPNELVRGWLGNELRSHVEHATAFARVPIVVRRGTPEDEAALVQHWVERATAAGHPRIYDREKEAVIDGIYFVLQPLFLDTIAGWTRTTPEQLRTGGRLNGLQASPYPKATAILIELQEDGSYLDNLLHPRWNPGVMGDFVELLAHEDAQVRERALYCLRLYSGCYFFADSDGEALEKLSDAQMKEAQALWHAWWTRNAATFAAMDSWGIWGYIDKTGTTVIPPWYAYGYPFKNGVARVTAPGEITAISERTCIDRSGAIVDCLTDPTRLRPVKVGEQWGYENDAGTLVIPARFGVARPFGDGLAPVSINGKFGFIDTEGAFVIPAQFDQALTFANGQAVVEVEGQRGIINRNGEVIFKSKYASIGRIVEDRIPFRVGQLSGFLDASGNVVIEPEYAHVEEFEEGIALVGRFVEVTAPSGGSMHVERKGFIDRSGNVVIPLNYSDIGPFSGGVAAVNLGDWSAPIWGYIDRTGADVIPAQYSGARAFSEGLAAVQQPKELGGKWGFIDINGTMVIPPQFQSATEFSEGVAAVSVTSPYHRLDPEDYRTTGARAYNDER